MCGEVATNRERLVASQLIHSTAPVFVCDPQAVVPTGWLLRCRVEVRLNSLDQLFFSPNERS